MADHDEPGGRGAERDARRTDQERGLLAAAATGHLGDAGSADRAALEALLARDPTAGDELAELRSVLGQLEPLRVPGAGWVEDAAAVVPLPAPRGPAAPAPAAVPVTAPSVTAPPVTAPPMTVPARGRAAWYALAACGLLAAGGLGGAVLRGAVDDRSAPVAVSGPPGTLGAQEDLQVRTASSSITATASLVAHTWGTETVLDVTGLPVGQTYQVVVVDEQGRAVVAGTFLGAARPVECTMNAAVLRQDAARVQVLDPAGQVVVTSELPPTA